MLLTEEGDINNALLLGLDITFALSDGKSAVADASWGAPPIALFSNLAA